MGVTYRCTGSCIQTGLALAPCLNSAFSRVRAHDIPTWLMASYMYRTIAMDGTTCDGVWPQQISVRADAHPVCADSLQAICCRRKKGLRG